MSSHTRRIAHTSPLLRTIGSTLLAAFVLAASSTTDGQQSISDLRAFEARAAKFNAVIAVPTFETTPKEIQTTLTATIAAGNRALDRIGRLRADTVRFDNTVNALDDVRYQATTAANRLSLIEQTGTNAAVRDAATSALKSLEDWTVGIDYRDDVYQSIKRYANTNPELTGEDRKLLSETLRDYRRAGLDLPKVARDRVERWRKELSALSADFAKNVTQTTKAVMFTKTELEGVPEDFLQQIRSGADEYTVMANVTFHLVRVMNNAKREETRRRLELERDNLARKENIPLIEKILPLRDRIAKTLGYASWADYSTEVKMAGNARTAIDFLEKLNTGLRPKFDEELEEFRRLKVKETGEPAAKVNAWDWRYYSNLLKKEKYSVDAEQLRVYFPYQRVLEGMFAIYQRIFDLRFEPVDPPYKWVDDLQMYAVSDAGSGEPLGLFYLDMFPREGKCSHFANFGVIDGRQLADGKRQRPVVALVCNFPTPSTNRPSLLSHGDVATLFHEFGHAIHAILTRARFARFSAWRVPRDFVEAPSQMLENWVWDKAVLDSFAADYRDPSKKIPADVLARLKEARLATEATRYQRWFVALGLMDLALHTRIHEGNARRRWMSNQIVGSAFLPVADDTAFLAYFGHFVGYDAGYYGYAWADAISADMATVFEKSAAGYFDKDVGMRLRKEIYEPGDSRDVNISIERFLGRPRSLEPLLRKIGIGPRGSKTGR
jgi:thimet oligopeptidase